MACSRLLGQIGRGTTIKSAKKTLRAWAFSERRLMKQPVTNMDPRRPEIKRNWPSVVRVEESHSHSQDQSGSYWTNLRLFSSVHKIGEGVIARQESQLKVWVKLEDTQPIEVNCGNVANVSEFLKVLKREFSPATDAFCVSRLILVKPNGIQALTKDLVPSLFGAMSFESPLVLLLPSKTIFIQNVDEDLQPVDSFSMVEVGSDRDIHAIFEKKASALVKIPGPSEPIVLVTKFSKIENQAKYRVFSRYENAMRDEVRWQQMEDKAMEEEAALATKAFLLKELGERVQELPRIISDRHGQIVQEWDGVFKVRETVYLGEAKHVMTLAKVEKFPERLQKFKDLLNKEKQPRFDGVKHVIGVACGTLFPLSVQKVAQKFDLICVFPSGKRYHVVDGFKMLRGNF